MKTLLDFTLGIVVVLLSATMLWFAYNQVTYLFPSLPAQWKYLSWGTVFCLNLLIRTMSYVLRYPTPETKLK